jgi:hypothetical protein
LTRAPAGFLILAALAAGCFGGGDLLPSASDVDAREVISFSERIEAFYATLENIPLDAIVTYENVTLRSHFVSESAFNDYYSSLANQVRRSNMRNSRPVRVSVREFRFQDRDVATVELMITGPYQRTLRFWDVELERVDTWKRLDGVWLLTPDKL